MARTDNLTNFLTDTAKAIKEKLNNADPILAKDFDAKIREIQTGGGKSEIHEEPNVWSHTDLDIGSNGASSATWPVDDFVIIKYERNEGADAGKVGILIARVHTQPGAMANWVVQYKYTYIKGIDTSDATAIAGNILKDKTAYARGEKIIGTLLPSGGKGEVLLFPNMQTMNTTKGEEYGDKALVYEEVIKPMQSTDRVQIVNFPAKVVLSAKVPDYTEVRLASTTEGRWSDFSGMIYSGGAEFSFYSEDTNFNVRYSTTDGLTFTRTDTKGNPVDFGEELYCRYPEYEWNDVFSNFILATKYSFQGLFDWEKYTDGMRIQVALDGEVYYLPEAWFDVPDAPKSGSAFYGTTMLVMLEHDENNVMTKFFFVSSAGSFGTNQVKGPNNLNCVAASQWGYTQKYNWDNGVYTYESIDWATETKYPQIASGDPLSSTYKASNMRDIQPTDKLFYVNGKEDNYFWLPSLMGRLENSGQPNDISTNHTIDKWMPLPTQFTAFVNDLLTNKVALGKEGEIIGDGSIYNNLDYDAVNKLVLNKNNAPELQQVNISGIEKVIVNDKELMKKDYFGGLVGTVKDTVGNLTIETEEKFMTANEIPTYGAIYRDFEDNKYYILTGAYTNPARTLRQYDMTTGVLLNTYTYTTQNFEIERVSCIKKVGKKIYFFTLYSTTHLIIVFDTSNNTMVQYSFSGKFNNYSGTMVCFTDAGVAYFSSYEGIYKTTDFVNFTKAKTYTTTVSSSTYFGGQYSTLLSKRIAVQHSGGSVIRFYNVVKDEVKEVAATMQSHRKLYSFDDKDDTYVLVPELQLAYKIDKDFNITTFNWDWTIPTPTGAITDVRHDEELDSMFIFWGYVFRYDFAKNKLLFYRSVFHHIDTIENTIIRGKYIGSYFANRIIRNITSKPLLEADYFFYKDGTNIYCRKADKDRLFNPEQSGGPISQDEYDTAIETAQEILGGEV